jgi:hypothetical protein
MGTDIAINVFYVLVVIYLTAISFAVFRYFKEKK